LYAFSSQTMAAQSRLIFVAFSLRQVPPYFSRLPGNYTFQHLGDTWNTTDDGHIAQVDDRYVRFLTYRALSKFLPAYGQALGV